MQTKNKQKKKILSITTVVHGDHQNNNDDNRAGRATDSSSVTDYRNPLAISGENLHGVYESNDRHETHHKRARRRQKREQSTGGESCDDDSTMRMLSSSFVRPSSKGIGLPLHNLTASCRQSVQTEEDDRESKNVETSHASSQSTVVASARNILSTATTAGRTHSINTANRPLQNNNSSDVFMQPRVNAGVGTSGLTQGLEHALSTLLLRNSTRTSAAQESMYLWNSRRELNLLTSTPQHRSLLPVQQHFLATNRSRLSTATPSQDELASLILLRAHDQVLQQQTISPSYGGQDFQQQQQQQQQQPRQDHSILSTVDSIQLINNIVNQQSLWSCISGSPVSQSLNEKSTTDFTTSSSSVALPGYRNAENGSGRPPLKKRTASPPAEESLRKQQDDQNSSLAREDAEVAKNNTMGKIVLPCGARGMPSDHNFQNAFLVIDSNVRHGDELLCSHTLCRQRGIKFRYCSMCRIPVAKRNFHQRHSHGLPTPGLARKPNASQEKPIARPSIGDSVAARVHNTPCSNGSSSSSDDDSHEFKKYKNHDDGSSDHLISRTSTGDKKKGGSPPLEDISARQKEAFTFREMQWLSLLRQRPPSTDTDAMASWLLDVIAISDTQYEIGSVDKIRSNHEQSPSAPSPEERSSDLYEHCGSTDENSRKSEIESFDEGTKIKKRKYTKTNRYS